MSKTFRNIVLIIAIFLIIFFSIFVFTETSIGKNFFKKNIGWLLWVILVFILFIIWSAIASIISKLFKFEYKRLIKKGNIFIGGLILLMIIISTFFNVFYGIKLRNKIKELKAEGKPVIVDEIIPASVPDSKNAALIYSKIFMVMTAGEGGKPYVSNKSDVYFNKSFASIFEDYKFDPYDINKWTKKQRKAVLDLFKSRDMQYISGLIEELARKPECNFNIDYKKELLLFLPLPHLNMMMRLEKLISIKFLLEVEAGNMDKAFELFNIWLKMGSHLKDGPGMVGELIRINHYKRIIDLLNTMLDKDNISVGKAKFILKELISYKIFSSSYIDSERVMGIQAFEAVKRKYIKSGNVTIYMADEFLGRYDLLALLYLFYFSDNAMIKKDSIVYLDYLSKVEQYYKKPYYEVEKFDFKKEIPRHAVLTNLLAPALMKLVERSAEHRSRIEIVRVGLALKIYKSENGVYPENLDKLTPGILKEIPVDPCSGKSLVYRKSKDGFILYSVGTNLKDDNGVSRYDGNKRNYKVHDIVWKCER
jgi:hypothetical protein